MSDPIETICNLTGCTREDAQRVYDETKDIVEAVDKLLEKVSSPAEKYIKKRVRQVTPEEELMAPVRKIMKAFDENMTTSLSQHGHVGQVEQIAPHEETVQQNNCSQKCQLPSLQ
jgi:hypothetical protein